MIDVKAAKQAIDKTKNASGRIRARDGARPHGGERPGAGAGQEARGHARGQSGQPVADQEPRPAKLDKLDGAAFDKAYIDNEVAYHKAVNAALKDTLIPSRRIPTSRACCKPA